MEPAYATGDLVLVESLSYRLRRPGRFEVVVIHDPAEPGRLAIKRIVGLPGETVAVEDGTLLVDGRPVAAPVRLPAYAGTVRTGDGYYVLGDNPAGSADSRTYGPVPPEFIVGRVLFALARNRKAAKCRLKK